MNANDPAFPTDKTLEYKDPAAGDYTCREVPKYEGLTKREYFAAFVLQGMVIFDSMNKDKVHGNTKSFVERVLIVTDALIAELSK